jgi:hypothetical protein
VGAFSIVKYFGGSVSCMESFWTLSGSCIKEMIADIRVRCEKENERGRTRCNVDLKLK